MNTFGNRFRFTSFGESHGKAIGGVIDGCPSGITINTSLIYQSLLRRRGAMLPKSWQGVSERAATETDEVEWLSGIDSNMQTLGSPIAFIIRNTEQRPADYNALHNVFRPSHADYTYYLKYGLQPQSGGGRASGRETAARVVAGCIAKQVLEKQGISIEAQIEQVGDCTNEQDISCLLEQLRSEGNSIGGIVRCTVHNVPAAIGEPIFNKLPARLAFAMLSINGCKGFDYGSGFDGIGKTGKQLNDAMPYSTNHAGGCLGGISNGQDIVFRCVFKPTPSIALPQQTINTAGEPTEIAIHGRHDTCFALRTPVIVESMAAMVLVDYLV